MAFVKTFNNGPGIIGTTLFAVVFFFQNCSNVEFSSKESPNSKKETSMNLDTPLVSITNPKVVINDGDAYTNAQGISVQASADNATEVYLTEAFTCDQEGEWYPLNKQSIQRNLRALNDKVIIYARFRNAEGVESECVSDAITHDNIAPEVEILGSVGANEITSKSDFDFSFDILEQGSGVGLMNCQLADQILPCLSLDHLFVSEIHPGDKNLQIEVIDRAGNKGRAHLPWKVVAELGAAGISINEGALYTKNNVVKLGLIAENATAMRVSEDSECKNGDIQPFQAHRDYVLKKSNDSNIVYAQFYNEAEDQTACLSASILHDSLPPELDVTGAPKMGDKIHDSFDFTVAAKDVGSGLKAMRCLLNDVDIQCDNGIPHNVTLNDEGVYTLKATALDNVDNETVFEASFEYLKSIGHIAIRINRGDAYTNHPTGAVQLQLEAINAKEMYITNQENCSSGGIWETYDTKKDWILSRLNSGSVSVFVKYRNTSAWVSECISASIIHDSIPYDIEYVDGPVTLPSGKPAELKYVVKEGGLALDPSDVVELKGCELVAEGGEAEALSCPEVGKVPLEGLGQGNYTVYVTVADAAKNETQKSHQFRVQEETPKCDDPLLADYKYVGECLALVDSFERDIVTGGDQFSWTSVIDDVARTDNHNVQANIFANGEYGFGEAADKNRAVYVTGRLGGSVHDVYLVSVPLNLSKFDKLKIDFNYLPIHLEKWSYKSQEGIEFIRLDICSSSMSDCGVGESSNASGLKSSHWQPIFTQKGYESGHVSENLDDFERGTSNTGRNHTKNTWLQGSATVDLNSSQVMDKSRVVFRITVKLDEGFEEEEWISGQKVPDFNSDLKDGVGLDNVKATAIQNQPEANNNELAGTFQ